MAEKLDESPRRKASVLGISGLVVSLLALAAAVLSPWAVDGLEPERKPIDEIAVDVAVRIKERLGARLKGKEFVPPPEEKQFAWRKWYPAGTIACGTLAICVGVVGFVRRESLRLTAATITVGLSAIVFQYFLLVAAFLLLVLLVGFVLSALDIFP